MKKALLKLIFVAAVGLSLQACMGSYAVGPPPPYPNNVAIGMAPSPRHMWVPGRYVYKSNSYQRSPGYYQIPPRGRTQYVEGSWNQSRKGYRYQGGGWR
jgi:hypothetical protein